MRRIFYISMIETLDTTSNTFAGHATCMYRNRYIESSVHRCIDINVSMHLHRYIDVSTTLLGARYMSKSVYRKKLRYTAKSELSIQYDIQRCCSVFTLTPPRYTPRTRCPRTFRSSRSRAGSPGVGTTMSPPRECTAGA